MSVIEISEDQRFPSVLNVKRGAELRRYVPERTCRLIDNGCELCCSECDGRIEYDYEANYRSICGARVMEEDE